MWTDMCQKEKKRQEKRKKKRWNKEKECMG
jgi:hypothetical protein